MTTEQNSAATYNIKCNQNETFQRTLTYKDSTGSAIDLTNFTAALQVRRDFDTAPVISLTESAGITLGGVAGTIAIVIASTATAALDANTHYYDLVITSPAGVKTRILEGKFDIVRGITR